MPLSAVLPPSIKNSQRTQAKLILFSLLLSFQTLPTSAAKVLGAGETLSIDLVSKALIGIITFTISYEYFTEFIETKLEGTPYIKIVNQVYKELTVMGLISFVVFMIGQVGDLFTNNPDIYMAFEYAHILIFFIALMIIISSAYLSVLNYRTSVAYLNTDLYTMPELLEMHETQNNRWWGRLSFHNFYLPNKLRSDFEFKILHNFFVSSYHVPRNFDFGMYLCESLDLQIVELVEVDVLSWFGIMAVVLANMLRVEANSSGWGSEGGEEDADEDGYGRFRFLAAAGVAADCNATDYDAGRRFLGAMEVDPCAPISIRSVETFAILGWTIFVGSCLLMFGAHSAFMKLMAKAGCKTSKEYEKRLAQINKKTRKNNPLGSPIRRRAISGRSLMPKHKIKEKKNNRLKQHLTKMGEGLGIGAWRNSEAGKSYNGSRKKIYAGGDGSDPPSPDPPSIGRIDERGLGSGISDVSIPEIEQQLSEDTRLSMTQLKSFVLEHQESEMHGHHGGGRGRRLSQAVNQKRSQMFAMHAFGKKPASSSGARSGGGGSLGGNGLGGSPAVSPVKLEGVGGGDGGLGVEMGGPDSEGQRGSIDMHNFGNQIKQEKMIQKIKMANLEKKGSMEKLVEVGKQVSRKAVNFSASATISTVSSVGRGGSGGSPTVTQRPAELQKSDTTDTMSSGGGMKRQMSLKTSHHRPRLQLDLRDIYWFGRADAFSTAVDFLLLLLCAYVAMMATNFGPLILKNSEADSSSGMWMFIMALPAALSLFPITRMINIVCKLKAVSVLDIEVVAKILEEHEEAEKVKDMVVRKFQEQMRTSGLVGRKALLELFRKVDTDESGFIDGVEFKTMLNMQQIFFTNKMFLHLFHAFDENNDNQISFEELEKVCFEGEVADLSKDPVSSGRSVGRGSGIGKARFKPSSKRERSKRERSGREKSGRKKSRDQRGITAIVSASRQGSLSTEGKKSSFNDGVTNAKATRESIAARRRSYMVEKQQMKRKSLLESAVSKQALPENRKSLVDSAMVDIVRKASLGDCSVKADGEGGYHVTKESLESALTSMLGQLSTNFLEEVEDEESDSGSESMDFDEEESDSDSGSGSGASDEEMRGGDTFVEPNLSSKTLGMSVDDLEKDLGYADEEDIEKGGK